MKEYVCVKVNHHKNIAKVIQEYLIDGWHLHTICYLKGDRY